MDAKCTEHGCYWKAENEHLKKCLLENFEEATAEVNVLRAALAAGRDALQTSADLRWKADMRAIKKWQKATGKTLVWPDHADLCIWLMEQLDTLGGLELKE